MLLISLFCSNHNRSIAHYIFTGTSGHTEWNKTVIETTLQSVENIAKLFETDGHLSVSSAILQSSVDSFVELIDGNILPCKAHLKLLEIAAKLLQILATKLVLNDKLNCVSINILVSSKL